MKLTPQEEIDLAILHGFDFIRTQQNLDGGIRWMDEMSSVPATLRVVIALAASGFSQDYFKSESESNHDFRTSEHGVPF